MADPLIVRPGISTVDRCPVMTRVKAFVVSQGTSVCLENTFRDAVGNPIDLVAALGVNAESLSDSLSTNDGGSIKLRVKEALGVGSSSTTNPIWEVTGTIIDGPNGVVRASIGTDITEHPGIYLLSWGVIDDDGNLILVHDGLLSVDRSLFAQDMLTIQRGLGPPTLGEIRGALLDSGPADNLLLKDIEFSTEQILHAIVFPIDYFNTTPPPIGFYTTRTFPFRAPWLQGIKAQLFLAASHSFRRNHLPYDAGGVHIDDKAKEKDYVAAYREAWQDYKDAVVNLKMMLQFNECTATIGSQYSRR